MKIQYNGIRVEKKLYTAYIYTTGENEAIRVSAKEYAGFPSEVWEMFDVKNESDIYTDYFDKDRFTVQPDHPMYPDFIRAIIKGQEIDRNRIQKKREKALAAGYKRDIWADRIEHIEKNIAHFKAIIGEGHGI